MIPEKISAFSFSSWYPLFKRITFKSQVIRLSDSAVAYLREDGIRLPVGVDMYVQAADETGPTDDSEGTPEPIGVP